MILTTIEQLCTLLILGLTTLPPHSKSERKTEIWQSCNRLWTTRVLGAHLVFHISKYFVSDIEGGIWWFTWCWGWHFTSALSLSLSQASVSYLKWFAVLFRTKLFWYLLRIWLTSCTGPDFVLLLTKYPLLSSLLLLTGGIFCQFTEMP